VRRSLFVAVCPALLFALNGLGHAEPTARPDLEKGTFIAYYPSLQKLEVRVEKLAAEVIGSSRFAKVRVVRHQTATPLADGQFPVSEQGGTVLLSLPKLDDGVYEMRLALGDGGPAAVKRFKHKDYLWLGNQLGTSDTVYPPYTPIQVAGSDASVVLRTYRLNGFGLWESVKSEGKELLAAPMALHVQVGSAMQTWRFQGGKWASTAPTRAVYQAEASTPAVTVRTRSSLEYDGCMKVEMDLLPGEQAQIIDRMWLDIPIQDKEAPLLHLAAFDKMRENYAGATPHGGKITWKKAPRGWLPSSWVAEPGTSDGVVWTCRDPRPGEKGTISPTDFVPYLWLGGATRGIAFFAANEKGYLVDPDQNVQQIERKGEALHLRVYLVNKPSVIAAPRHLVFGLEASPTRPMPENWRNITNIPPHGGPVVCWGGYHCADKYPDAHNFKIVDAIQEVRRTGVADMEVFRKFDRERAEPWKKMWEQSNEEWLGVCLPYFVNQARGAHNRPNQPLVTYFEEHQSDIANEEWEVYQDEWRGKRFWKERTEIVGRMQPRNTWTHGQHNYPSSYRDFCLYYANEWMKRGIGPYFDNTMPYTQYNPLTSDAYLDEKGKLHPACSIWDQRAYYKRVWTLMQQLTGQGVPYPLVYVQHTTNTMLPPINTWNTATLDIEWTWTNEKPAEGRRRGDPNPFPPDLLLAETCGRQTGSFPHALHSLRGGDRSFWQSKDPAVHIAEWGFRTVHEILPGAAGYPPKGCQAVLRDFGYGKPEVAVHNYWAEEPPIAVSDANVKWLALARKKDNGVLVVLQSWNRASTPIDVTINAQRLGFTPKAEVFDVESGALPMMGTSLKCSLPGPFGTKVIVFGAKP